MLFLSNDEIIRQGDFGNRMYFISSGTVDVYLTSEKSQAKKKPNVDRPDIESESEFSEDEESALLRSEIRINRLSTGSYFGEVAIVTNLKRTTTVKAFEYTTLAYLTRENFADIRKEFPQVYLNFKYNIKQYTDTDFEFRRNMIKNTPYFRNLDKEIIDEIVYLLRPNRYDPNTTIIKYGDITDKIHYLKQGEVNVTIPVKTGVTQTETHFETLNAGS
jgi:CRP-like cAMP-binding protein